MGSCGDFGIYLIPDLTAVKGLQHNYSSVNDHHIPIMNHFLVPKWTVDRKYQGVMWNA